MGLSLALVFLGVAAAAWVALQPGEAAVRAGRRARELLRRHPGPGAARGESGAEEAGESGARAARHSNRRRLAVALDGLLAGFKFSDRLAFRLRRADLRIRPGEFTFITVLLGAAGLVLGGTLGHSLLLGLVGLGVGLSLPPAYLGRRADRRARQFSQQLPDALGIMANCLRSGYSIVQAFDVVGRELPAPIGREFDQVTREIRVNIPVEDALANLLKRVGSPDLDLAVTAILIQRQVGGNLAEVLDRITYTIRERVRILGEVRTLTAQGRASGWVIGLLPLGLGVIIFMFDPGYMRPLLALPVGWLLLGGAAAMEIIGVLVISRIVRIEV